MGSGSLSRDLARFINSLSYEVLPEEVVEQAKLRILDALSCSFAGRDRPWSRIAVDLVKNNRGDATIISYEPKVPTVDAAFANGVLAHSILQEDFVGLGHPSTMVVPATLAVAEQEGASGADVITALVVGYDIFARSFLGGTIHPGFRTGAIVGPLGVAASVGKLLKLSEDQIVNCLGYGANFGAGQFECWEAGTMEAMFHAGMSARSGIVAVALAKAGATAAERALEGADGFYHAHTGTTTNVEHVTANLGKRFFILDVTIKPYPACGFVQILIELALSLKRQYGIEPKDIDTIVERLSPFQEGIPCAGFVGPFTSQFQAQMSGPFCIAAALLSKPVSSHAFYRDHYDDPEVFALAKKVKVVGEEGRTLQKLEISMRDGKQFLLES